MLNKTVVVNNNGDEWSNVLTNNNEVLIKNVRINTDNSAGTVPILKKRR